MEQAIEEVKKRIDIVQFLGNYIEIKKTGRNFKALCPFHQEKSASFVVSPDRQIWHCFGTCGDGGDIIKFLMKWEGITFGEALRELAIKAGVTLDKSDVEDKEWNKQKRLIQINTLAAEYYEYILHSTSVGSKAREYIESRHINEKIAKKFQLGYAPSSWSSLLTFLKKKGFYDSEIEEVGLSVKSPKDTFYDRFRGRIMFPIRDHRGNTIGFSGRILDSQEKSAKYVNTPETPLYHKRESLFGIDIAKEAIKREQNVLLVEGEFDVISPYQYGVENIVAIKGSAVTKEQLLLLKRYTNKVTLALDADAAGEEAVRRGIEAGEEVEMDIGIVQFENGKDPDEAVRNNVSLFKETIKKPIPIYDFILQMALKKFPGTDAYTKKNIGDMVMPFVSRIKNPIVQSYYIKQISHVLEVSEQSLSELMRKLVNKNRYKPRFTVKKPPMSKVIE